MATPDECPRCGAAKNMDDGDSWDCGRLFHGSDEDHYPACDHAAKLRRERDDCRAMLDEILRLKDVESPVGEENVASVVHDALEHLRRERDEARARAADAEADVRIVEDQRDRREEESDSAHEILRGLNDAHAKALDELAAARREVERLTEWLIHIGGGDAPCDNAEQLRRWAYEAITLGRNVDEASEPR